MEVQFLLVFSEADWETEVWSSRVQGYTYFLLDAVGVNRCTA